MIAKLICTVDMRQRPAMRERTSRSASSLESEEKRSTSSCERPIVLPSRIPDTDNDSSTSVDMSASRLCVTDWMRRRSLPTRRVSHTKNGSRISEKSVSSQLRANIATTVAVTVATVDTVEVAVLVTTLSMPPMSYAIRACTSPERVRVKNASDMRCRCANTAARRSCITRWPTWLEIHVCRTPSTPLITASAIMPATSHVSSTRSCPMMPLLIASRSRNGEATLRIEPSTIRPSSVPRRMRYGMNSLAMRRNETCLSGVSSGRGDLPRERRPSPPPCPWAKGWALTYRLYRRARPSRRSHAHVAVVAGGRRRSIARSRVERLDVTEVPPRGGLKYPRRLRVAPERKPELPVPG